LADDWQAENIVIERNRVLPSIKIEFFILKSIIVYNLLFVF